VIADMHMQEVIIAAACLVPGFADDPPRENLGRTLSENACKLTAPVIDAEPVPVFSPLARSGM